MLFQSSLKDREREKIPERDIEGPDRDSEREGEDKRQNKGVCDRRGQNHMMEKSESCVGPA